MNSKIITRLLFSIPFCVVLIASQLNAHGATNIVLNVLGALPSAITSAAANDTLVLEPGNYADNVVFSKPLIVLRGTGQVSNSPVILSGPVQIQGTNGTSSFQQIYFSDNVTIGASNHTVTFVGCQFGNSVTSSGASLLLSSNYFQQPLTIDLSIGSTTNLQAFDTTFLDVKVNAGNVVMKRCHITSAFSYGSLSYNCGLQLDNGVVFQGIRLTNDYGIEALNGGNATFTLVQSSVGVVGSGTREQSEFNSYKVSLAYNDIHGRIVANNCDSMLIGNLAIDYDPTFHYSGFNAFGGSVKAYNNAFYCYWSWSVFMDSLNARGAEFINNSIYNRYEGEAFYATGEFPVHFLNNACLGLVSGSRAVWDMSYCVLDRATSVGVPIGGFGSQIGVNPNWVNAEASSLSGWALNTNSPCIGNGSPLPVYNNRGRTNRNDIGFTGGPYLNAANYTNTDPIVFFLTGAPLVFPKGLTNVISVNVGASAGN